MIIHIGEGESVEVIQMNDSLVEFIVNEQPNKSARLCLTPLECGRVAQQLLSIAIDSTGE